MKTAGGLFFEGQDKLDQAAKAISLCDGVSAPNIYTAGPFNAQDVMRVKIAHVQKAEVISQESVDLLKESHVLPELGHFMD